MDKALFIIYSLTIAGNANEANEKRTANIVVFFCLDDRVAFSGKL